MIFWFRNDLRVHDNTALVHALEKGCKKAVFLSTPKQWKMHNLAPIKVDFILRHVAHLKVILANLGIELIYQEVDDFSAQAQWLANYCRDNNNSDVYANSELEVNEVNRDKTIISSGVNLHLFESDVIVPKGKVLNKSNEMYKVFTPFKNAWLSYIKDRGFEYISKIETEKYAPKTSVGNSAGNLVESSVEAIAESSAEQNGDIETLITQYQTIDSSAWPLASEVEADVIPRFLADKISNYQLHRDIPSIRGTSGLSAYLAIGAISSRYLLALLLQRYPDILSKSPEAEFTWLNELIWREFYRHLLFHFPNLCKSKNFNEKYNHLPWPNSQGFYIAWQQGKTGYPLVDAAMRQLNQTGWMHNRLRMVVASFLTKHLLVDWRLGEAYFMSKLIDGDLAANNGGWQWSAGTGCDAQPYFRVFNPITQSERFDPNGDFIRKYLPELNNVPNKHIHFPHVFLDNNNISSYWPAVVEHKMARLNALDFYKANS